MKKILLISVIALFAFAMVGMVKAAPNWDITGTWTISFKCTYGCPEGPWEHVMEVTLEDLGTGEFEGHGYYTGGTYEWEITSGVVEGDDIDFEADYTTGTSCTMNVGGTIASDGLSMSGEWSDNCWDSDRGGTWTATGTACKLNTYYQDLDGDGYGNPEVSVLACERPEGYVENSDDCNDEDSEINPDAEEVCDTIDNNCDGDIDTHTCNWYCAETEKDPWQIDGSKIGTAGYLGVNRLAWYSGDYFTTLSSKTVKGKTNFFAAQSEFTLDDTNGCSCSQILEILHEYNPEVYGDMEGHWKFGCSKSVVEEFIRLAVEHPEVQINTFTVPATTNTPTQSNVDLEAGKTYKIVAEGTYYFRTYNHSQGYLADAEWALRNDSYGTGWVKGDSSPYSSPYNGLDLCFDVNTNTDWGDFSEDHIYSITYTPTTTSKISLFIKDSYYGDNSGYLTVKIYRVY